MSKYMAAQMDDLIEAGKQDFAYYSLRVDELEAANAAMRDRVAVLEAALRGLVGVKDMRLRLIKLHEMGHGTDYTDYYRLKPLAWAAARAALEQMP